jgi:hypothetical protein
VVQQEHVTINEREALLAQGHLRSCGELQVLRIPLQVLTSIEEITFIAVLELWTLAQATYPARNKNSKDVVQVTLRMDRG